MDIQEYISSGILETYCLGILSEDECASVLKICKLYPEVRQELKEIEAGLEHYAGMNAIQPPTNVFNKISRAIDDTEREKTMDGDDLPLISKFSDYKKWKLYVESLLPDLSKPGINIHMLRHADGVAQMLVSATVDIDEEIHTDALESFLILEGECECTVGNEVFRLKPGGYISIPLHESHNVKLLSPRVTAILQHIEVGC